jgi:DNA polymerase III subunit chi
MATVVYYILEDTRLLRLRQACLLINQAFLQGQRVYIRTASEEEANVMDDLLWTFRDISFLPHRLLSQGYEPETPIWIGWTETPPILDLMLNLAHPMAEYAYRFERIIEVIDNDPVIRRQGRERYRDYQRQGYAIELNNLTDYQDENTGR